MRKEFISRWHEFWVFLNDPGLYMPKERLEYYKVKDPVKIGRKYLLEKGKCSEQELAG